MESIGESVCSICFKAFCSSEHKCNIKIEIEPSSNPNKIEIKDEPLMEYENIVDEYSMMKTEPLEIESIQSNEVNLTYENFIMKNEEVDIKSKSEESDSTEQIQKVIQEHDKINPWNVTSKHFTVDHKNNEKTSRTSKIYNTSNIPKFMCDVCDYKAKEKGNLKKHMLKHMNADEIEMFSCDVCDHKVKRKGHLKSHMLQHKSVDEIEMFKCNVCDHKAKQKGNLKKHMLIHKSVDEIEMFTCDVCDYKTKWKECLKSHMLKHINADEIEMFSCDVCDHKVKRKGYLKLHMLRHKHIDEINVKILKVENFSKFDNRTAS